MCTSLAKNIQYVQFVSTSQLCLTLHQQPMPIPRTRLSTSAEHAHIDHYRRLRQKLHDSPLYTILDPSARIQKPGELTGAWKPHAQIGGKKAVANPFETMATYSHKYKKRRRTMPELDNRGYGGCRRP
jgi:DNA-directed RNA polymerase III subunit RPC7